MAKKQLSNAESLALVKETLQVHDPHRETVVVGSAAFIAHLDAAGIEAPIGCDYVDVLCSQGFFDKLLSTGPHLQCIRKFQC